MAETGLHVTGVASREWGYNTRGELIAEDAPGAASDRGYRYDGIGNRIRTAVHTTNTTTATGANLGTYFASSGGAAGANPVNQYGQIALPGQAPVAVVHDLDGNMTSGPLPSAPGSVSHFSWDAENRLTQVAVGGGGGTVSYRYDPFGRRIARILGNITELTLYDGWNPVAEYANTPQSPTISLKRTFVWGLDVSGSLQGAGGVDGLLAIREAAGNGSSKAGQAIFPAYDGNGNIIRLTDSNGATVASYAYDGFGNRINPAASDINGSGYANENRYGFSTKPRDPLTGLLYYGYRWYDPATGRWASRDPIEESGGLNLYGFVFNDSLSWYDYLGGHPEKYPNRRRNNRGNGRTGSEQDKFPIRVVIGNVTSALSGDLFHGANPIPKYDGKQCEFLITVSGIFMKGNTQQEFLDQIHSLENQKHIKNPVFVNNPTNGAGDIIQILFNEIHQMTRVNLDMVRQIEAAANAAERNNCCCWSIQVIAHSQGTMIFERALALIGADTKKHIHFIGLGGESILHSEMGLASTLNITHKDDVVPKLSPGNWKYFREEIDTDSHNPDKNKDDPHSWEHVYVDYLDKNPGKIKKGKICK